MNRGGRANQTGFVLETTVAGTLQGHGYLEICPHLPKKRKRDWLLLSTEIPKRYAKQVYIGSSIYETEINVDFYIVGSGSISQGLIVECKWQEDKGSVDEKYPYLNLNIKNCYQVPTIVIVGGEGMRQGSIDWFKKQIGDNQNLLGVYKLEGFITWANKYL
jgi:hypothetical protein